MKVYLIENSKKMIKIKKELEEFNIESREDFKIKMTKNDFVIVNDDKEKTNEIEKLKNIIFITNEKDYKHIWKLANNYKTIDIIDSNQSEEYIATRIKRLIRSNG